MIVVFNSCDGYVEMKKSRRLLGPLYESLLKQIRSFFAYRLLLIKRKIPHREKIMFNKLIIIIFLLQAYSTEALRFQRHGGQTKQRSMSTSHQHLRQPGLSSPHSSSSNHNPSLHAKGIM